ncbi:uncharacterized protein LOC116346545 [Contarinia nasturtii]|uniref:uncharacterized protein LOC116346545 n=1 Tax=Contarinia nasturtii TaxID=265458 RepID=UPI0012D42A8C|nr:uncharacterized protein LOC116346545 [Contarinia nasturtii]
MSVYDYFKLRINYQPADKVHFNPCLFAYSGKYLNIKRKEKLSISEKGNMESTSEITKDMKAIGIDVDKSNNIHQFKVEEKSSMNLCDVLNDDHICKIFRYLEIEDLCVAADVCTRFRKNAIKIAENRSINVEIYSSRISGLEVFISSRRPIGTLIKHLITRLFRNFGQCVNILNISYVMQEHNNRIMDLFTTYCCGEKSMLTELKICVDSEIKEAWIQPLNSIFARIESLQLKCQHGDFIRLLNACRSLKTLHLNGSFVSSGHKLVFSNQHLDLLKLDFSGTEHEAVERFVAAIAENPISIDQLEISDFHLNSKLADSLAKLHEISSLEITDCDLESGALAKSVNGMFKLGTLYAEGFCLHSSEMKEIVINSKNLSFFRCYTYNRQHVRKNVYLAMVAAIKSRSSEFPTKLDIHVIDEKIELHVPDKIIDQNRMWLEYHLEEVYSEEESYDYDSDYSI